MILHEVNVKEIEFLNETEGILVKEIKADFKKLGPRFGKAHERCRNTNQ